MIQWCKHQYVNIILGLIIIILGVFVTDMVRSFVKLKTSSPLSNFRGNFITPVNLADPNTTLHAVGTFDRPIQCNLIDFKTFFTNQASGDIIVLTPKHVITAPPSNISTGTDINISFELSVPSTMTTGFYSPVFHGTYICMHGIFTEVKVERIIVPIVKVINQPLP